MVTFEESAEQDMNAPRRSYNIIQTPINTVDLSSINAISSSPEAKVSSKRRTQKYRKAWEDLPECRGWLEPLDDNVYKAKCIACDKEMMADVTVIRNHAQAKKHLKNCENMQDEKLSAVCKKSFEAAKKSRKATGKAASWSTSDAKVSTDNDDIQIIDFDSLSIKGSWIFCFKSACFLDFISLCLPTKYLMASQTSPFVSLSFLCHFCL